MEFHKGERVFRGIPVSPGVSCGKILVVDVPQEAPILEVKLSDEELPQQVQRLEKALVATRRDILEVQRRVTEGMGSTDASIFDAHLLVLEDPALIEEVSRCIFQEKASAECAFQKVAEKYIRTLSEIQDEYLKERAADMRDVTARVLDHLLGRAQALDLRKLEESCILICKDLTPSRTAQLDTKMVLGFATDVGSRTSHTAILARSLRIPAVVGLRDASREIRTGDYGLLDGYNGVVILNPTDQTLFEYGQLVRRHVTLEQKLQQHLDQPAVMLDGHRILLSANLERPEDASMVRPSGAEGVGLFRTEYLFVHRETLPSEEEQYHAYRRVAVDLNPAPVIIRTLDVGGDKLLSHLHVPQEMNPFLGWRAIRFCLHQKDIFRAQLRAILRASAEGNVKLMYPMISGLEELTQANALVREYMKELEQEGLPFNRDLEIGAMIEIPSAALAARDLAKRVKFFSIGTNDLIQYALAVDRMNEKIAHLYQPTHPAILRLIRLTVEAAQEVDIPVSVCGEMAGDVVLVPLLVGLGVGELSMAPHAVPPIKHMIRRMKLNEAQDLAQQALQCESGAEILARSEAYAKSVAPALFES